MRGLFSTRTSQLSGNAPRRMIQRILLIAPTISSLRILVWPILLTPPNRVLPPVDRKNVNVGHMLLHLRAGQASYDARRRRYPPLSSVPYPQQPLYLGETIHQGVSYAASIPR